MKKGFLFLLIVLGGTAVFCIFRFSSPRVQPDSPVIVTSGYVPYLLVKEIGGAQTPVQLLLPPGAEPHSFEPSPGSLIAVHNARAFLYVSDVLEPGVKDVRGAAGKKTRVVALADMLPPSDDPHVWMNFDAVREMARTVKDTLVQLAPENAEMYAKNLARFEQEISALDNEFKQGLSRCEHREIIHIGHLAFGSLAKRYHLTLTALAGTSHDGEHSAQKLAALVKHIRAAKVQTLFTEGAVSPRLAQTVAAETGTKLLPLYTVEDVSKDDFMRGVSYEDFMRRNLKSLQEGLKCQK